VRKRNRDYVEVTNYIQSNQKSILRIVLTPCSPLGASASAPDYLKFQTFHHHRQWSLVELCRVEQARKATSAQQIGFDRK
jgi:hypothetical protein